MGLRSQKRKEGTLHLGGGQRQRHLYSHRTENLVPKEQPSSEEAIEELAHFAQEQGKQRSDQQA